MTPGFLTLAIDPGKREYGWALAEDYTLADCGLKQVARDKPGFIFEPNEIIVEMPQQRGTRSRVRVSDLLDLAYFAGAVAGPGALRFTPSRWKGNESKESMHVRLLTILSADEQKIVEEIAASKSKRHNVLDAICFLMWRLKRM
jgi:hypothetical protein